jgi:hypothetical protein
MFAVMNPWLLLNGNEMARTWAGKICHLQAVPEEDIETFPDVDPVTQVITDDIVLKNGKAWIIVKLLSAGKAFSEESEETSAGPIVNQSVSGLLFGVSEYNHLQVNNWRYRRWVLLLREVGSGITYVIGSPANETNRKAKGALFSFGYDNSNTTLTKIQFAKQSATRAFIYKGTLGTAGTGTGTGSTGTSTVKDTIEFLVGDVGYTANGGTQYSHASLINKTIAVYLDGVRIRGSVDANRISYSFNTATGTITWTSALYTGQLVTIDFE